MAGLQIESVEQLLAALAREQNLRGKLRLLGHSWKLLRSLSPGEREKVALSVGSKWVWRRVEKAFMRDGELGEYELMVGQALERLGDADPKELRHIAGSLKDGDPRAARDLLLEALSDVLEDEADAGAELEDAGAELEDAGAELEDAGAELEDAGAELEIEEGGADEEEPLLEIDPLPEEPPAPSTPTPTTQVAAKVGTLVDTASGVLASSRARVTKPAEPRVPTPSPPTPSAPPPPPRFQAATAEPAPSPSPLPIAAADGADRLRVLRALQRSEEPAADLGHHGRGELLESLGGGWASRRALSRMITAKSLDGLDEALRLIRRLESPGQQAWCLADLIHHWSLEHAEIERILAAAPTEATRRRLARRIHAA